MAPLMRLVSIEGPSARPCSTRKTSLFNAVEADPAIPSNRFDSQRRAASEKQEILVTQPDKYRAMRCRILRIARRPRICGRYRKPGVSKLRNHRAQIGFAVKGNGICKFPDTPCRLGVQDNGRSAFQCRL